MLIVSISEQVRVFLYAIIGGMLSVFIYDIFRIRRRTIQSGNLLIYIEDFVFWLIATVIIFCTIYLSNETKIRGYVFLGIAIGGIFYILTLSKIIIKISVEVVIILSTIIKLILRIIKYPVKLILLIGRLLFKKLVQFVWPIVKPFLSFGRNYIIIAGIIYRKMLCSIKNTNKVR